MAYIYDLTDTWNAGGTTFYGIKMNVTNTASASGSKLLSLQVGGSELFGVDKNGNVGIGTSSPGAKLDVQGSGSVYARARSLDTTGGAIGYVGAEFAGGSAIQIRAGQGYTYLVSTGASDPLLFGTNSTERMRITSAGDVLVGKTSASVGTDGIQLIPAGYSGFSAAGTTALFLNRNTNDGTILEFGRNGVAAATMGLTSSALTFGTAGSERMRITAAGDIRLGQASLATNATTGFPYIPTCAGTPTGTPAGATGFAPMVVDSTNNKLYVYVGGAWQAMN